jgi:hypothetical protein
MHQAVDEVIDRFDTLRPSASNVCARQAFIDFSFLPHRAIDAIQVGRGIFHQFGHLVKNVCHFAGRAQPMYREAHRKIPLFKSRQGAKNFTEISFITMAFRRLQLPMRAIGTSLVYLRRLSGYGHGFVRPCRSNGRFGRCLEGASRGALFHVKFRVLATILPDESPFGVQINTKRDGELQ